MKNILYITLLLLVLVGCASNTVRKEVSSIANDQQELVDFYAHEKTTPLNAAEKEHFKGITFFPIDLKYKVEATFTPIQNGEIIPFPTSAGKIKHYQEYGKANFELDGQMHEVTIYQSHPIQEAYADHLFLPFTDDTNGDTTYGGGRYIDLSMQNVTKGNGQIIIDFNQAYNPYCAYSKRYNCPIPPGNNSIAAEIKAGVTYTK